MIRTRINLKGKLNSTIIKEYPPLDNLEVTPTKEQQVFNHEDSYGYDNVTVKAIGDEYIIPNGTLEITENGHHKVSNYESANVNVTFIPNLQNKEVTPTKETQNITSDADYDGLGNVTVNPIPDEYIIPNGTLDINANGETDVTMFRMARIGVHTPPKLQDKEITPTKETQNITSDEGYDGLSKVTVNPIPNEYVVPSGTLEITENGEQDVTSYSSVNVNIAGTGKYAPKVIYFRDYTGTDLTYETENLDTSNVTTMKNMFYGCTNLTGVDTSSWNTNNVTDMSYMFYNCKALRNLNTTNWNTSNVTTMANMFWSCNNLRNIDISNWNTSNVTSMINMFANCYQITEIDMSHFDTSKVKSMYAMFSTCDYLTTVNLSGLDLKNVTDMGSMFSGGKNLISVNFSGVTGEKTTNFDSMFYNCWGKLTEVDLSSLTCNPTNTRSMFASCSVLTRVDISGFNGSGVTNSATMFSGCSKLTTLIINNPNVFNMTNVNMLNNTPIKSGTGYVYVPDDLVDTYKSATNWSAYASQIKPLSELPE